MDMQLEGKSVVITGASRGIGLATARALTREGARVVGAARKPGPELEAAAVAVVAADVATPEGAREVVETALAVSGGIDILVNNVGAGDIDQFQSNGFLGAGDEQWTRMIEVNLLSAVRTARAALPSIIERRGAIVNIASISARVPSSGPTGYSEAKSALIALGKRLSEEFGPLGVRVNTISPGPVATGLWRDSDGFGARMAAGAGVPHGDFLAGLPAAFGMAGGRMVEPEEVPDLVAFLVSQVAASVIGSDVVIDGGTLKHC